MKPVKKRAYFILKFLLLLLICSIIIWYLSMVVYFVFQWNLFFSPHQTILVEITESDGPHYFGDKAACYVLRARKNIWLELDWKNVDCDVIEENSAAACCIYERNGLIGKDGMAWNSILVDCVAILFIRCVRREYLI